MKPPAEHAASRLADVRRPTRDGRRVKPGWAFAIVLVVGTALVLLGPGARGQQILQYGFEAHGPVWKPGSTDTASKVLVHELTEETRHGGQRCEHIKLQVEKGSWINYTFDLPRAPVTDELNVSLYLKSNRPGIQLLCRIVLPREKDEKNLGQPMTVMVRCEPYQGTRWKLVSLNQPPKKLREQQQLLTHQYGRDINTVGAYIDQLVLNLYDGPGLTEVWIDDLEVGPVVEARTITAPTALPTPTPAISRGGEVPRIDSHNRLWVNNKLFLMRGIRHTGTPLLTLREAGFNTVWLDETTPGALIDDAANLGFWLVPEIHIPPAFVSAGPNQLAANETFVQKVSEFASRDAVLAWGIGSNLEAENLLPISRFARTFQEVDQQQPVIADVWDGYRGYSINLPRIMLGTHRWPLMTSMELPAYCAWLMMRRNLSRQNYSWTWIQTHLPEWFTRLAYETEGQGGFTEPVGPQPEQIRLLTYIALGAGCRGLAFWSDRFLADSHQGKDRLLAMALLNQELKLLERVLVQSTQAPDWIETGNPDVRAALFRTQEGILVVPIWMGKGAQFVPGQGASAELELTVPGVPVTATAWEVSPGRIQSYPIQRVPGGTLVKLHNFSMTSAVLFTSDLSPTGLVVRLQDTQRREGPRAAQWLLEQGQEELAKVEKVQAALEQQGHSVPDGKALLDKARKALARSMQHRRDRKHTEAYNEAEVALRSLRTLMHAHWERAVRDLDTPVASPYAVSFYTLPKHWQMLDELRHLKSQPSILPDGDFEAPPETKLKTWFLEEAPSLDPVKVEVRRVTLDPHHGKQCLMMKITPSDLRNVPAVLERTYVMLHSSSVKLKPGSLVRICGWVRIPGGIAGSADGVQIYDSIGGEPLSVRLIEATDWKRFSLYRRAPASGEVSVTLAMSGMGVAYFDDIHIDPLVPAGPGDIPPPANRARQARAARPGR
jgi:hypothetical protein